jgi:geranylgeranyl reductase family protein
MYPGDVLYDLIVVGAGPAGSTAARVAASAGATVLLLDRATFPRDKPCGGGVNLRAAKLLPFSLGPVAERTITGLTVTLNLRPAFSRRTDQPLCYMTQRTRLDALLAEQAIRAGAVMRDGLQVKAVEAGECSVGVSTQTEHLRGRFVVGADGANGVVARSCGLDGGRRPAVAIEANYAWDAPGDDRWLHTIVMDLGLIPGGYGWLFPKGDHLNIGVGGWQHFAPTLRARLERLTASFGRSAGSGYGFRGHSLPVRTAGAPLCGGRVMLVGDAAGLVDPLSGEGIYAAIYSGQLAALTAVEALSSSEQDITGYERGLNASLCPDLLASQRFQDVFHLMPSIYARLLGRSDRLWDVLCGIVRGDQTYLDLRRRMGPLARWLDVLAAVVHAAPLRTRLGLDSA